jgi:TM2 domain-containing membrane protein YozV
MAKARGFLERPGNQVKRRVLMGNIFRALLAGWGARRLTGGCGCMGILVFILLFWLLGRIM